MIHTIRIIRMDGFGFLWVSFGANSSSRYAHKNTDILLSATKLEAGVVGIRVLKMLQDADDSGGLVDGYAAGCFSQFFLDNAKGCPIMETMDSSSGGGPLPGCG